MIPLLELCAQAHDMAQISISSSLLYISATFFAWVCNPGNRAVFIESLESVRHATNSHM